MTGNIVGVTQEVPSLTKKKEHLDLAPYAFKITDIMNEDPPIAKWHARICNSMRVMETRPLCLMIS